MKRLNIDNMLMPLNEAKTNAGTTPFDILNQEAVQFTLNLQEDDNTNFFKLVERLKAGEKIPNVCLTKRDTVAFFIP